MPTAQIWDGAAWVEIQSAASPHHAAHEPGGADAMAVDAAAGTGSLRTLGTGAAQAAVGSHAHSGSYEAVGVAAGLDATHVAAADPHTGYVLESLLDAKGDLIAASADNTPAKVTVGSDGQVLTADAASTPGVKWAAASGGGNAIYGDASDGIINFDGTTTVLGLAPSSGVYTLTRDVYLASGSQVSGTAIIKTVGYRIFCTGTLTVGASASINNDGNAASGSTQGASIGAGFFAASGAGGAGTTGSNGGATAQTNSVGGAGGAGGNGSSGTGGPAAGATAPAATAGGVPRTILGPLTGTLANAATTLKGGAGGSGASGNGTNTGGGGGGGAGILAVFAKAIVNSGTVSANGGAGGTGPASNTGGGGGGGGGCIWLVYNTFTGNAATANGGTFGAAGAGGTAGSVGSAGRVISLVNV